MADYIGEWGVTLINERNKRYNLAVEIKKTDVFIEGEPCQFNIIRIGQREVCLIYSESMGTMDVSHEFNPEANKDESLVSKVKEA